MPLASALPLALRHQSNRFSKQSIVKPALGLCGNFLSVCLKRYQFLWLHLINFRHSKFGTKPCLFAPISIAFVSCQFASAKAPVRCGFRERAPSSACKWQLRIGRWRTIIMILKWQANSYVMFSSLLLRTNIYLCANIRIRQLHMNRSSLEPPWIAL